MKKVLLASVALVAFAGAAQAADKLALSIGGYAYEAVGYAGNKTALAKSKVDSQDDVVVSFAGTTKLDNGVTVGVNVDTFGSQRQDSRNVNGNCGKTGLVGTANCTGNSNVKRSYTTVSGVFGAVIVGEREDVGYIVHNSAPTVGATGLQDGSWFQWIASPSQHRLYNTTNASRYDDRGNKVTYVTPTFQGFTAGVTYAPSISNSTSGHTSIVTNSDYAVWGPKGMINGADFGGDLYVGGVAYANKFGDVSIKADAGVGQANIVNLRVFQGGTQISYQGFTVGGSIFNRSVPSNAELNGVNTVGALGGAHVTPSALARTAAYAGQSWDAGVSYANGPASVSVGYFHDVSKSVQGLNGTGKSDSTAVWELGAAYVMGPGVTLKGSIANVDYKGDILSSASAASVAANNNKGTLVVTGVKVDF